MKDIEKSIVNAKSFIFDHKCFDKKYSRVWAGATENIKEYFELMKWEEIKKALTVCSSGDHILNLVNKGVKEIDAFDINPLTFPYLNLRIAFIQAFDYKDYFKFFNKLSIASHSEIQEYEIFSIVKSYLKYPYNIFWEELFSENIKRNKHNIMEPGLLGKICKHYIPFGTSKLRNQWMYEKSEYEKTKHNLKNCTINFKCTDVLDVPNIFSKGYDKILLSNIADYLPKSTIEFDSFIRNELASILNTNGEILAAYIYHFIDNGERRGIHFKNSYDSNYYVFENNYQIFEVNNVDDFGSYEYASKDAVLVYKKNR